VNQGKSKTTATIAALITILGLLLAACGPGELSESAQRAQKAEMCYKAGCYKGVQSGSELEETCLAMQCEVNLHETAEAPTEESTSEPEATTPAAPPPTATDPIAGATTALTVTASADVPLTETPEPEYSISHSCVDSGKSQFRVENTGEVFFVFHFQLIDSEELYTSIQRSLEPNQDFSLRFPATKAVTVKYNIQEETIPVETFDGKFNDSFEIGPCGWADRLILDGEEITVTYSNRSEWSLLSPSLISKTEECALVLWNFNPEMGPLASEQIPKAAFTWYSACTLNKTEADWVKADPPAAQHCCAPWPQGLATSFGDWTIELTLQQEGARSFNALGPLGIRTYWDLEGAQFSALTINGGITWGKFLCKRALHTFAGEGWNMTISCSRE
jgi:hypothetical protein